MLKTLSFVSSEWMRALISLCLLCIGLVVDYLESTSFTGITRLVFYVVAYLPVALPVWLQGIRLAAKGEIFTEFFLMGVATLGAFYLGEYPEGVAVMVFYAIGELFQGAAVRTAKKNIRALLELRPKTVMVKRDGTFVATDPEAVRISDVVQVKPGERVALDGKLLSISAVFNTAALTGESTPVSKQKHEEVLSGMINESSVIELEVVRAYNDSALARILALVQNAQGRKAKTELLIRRFARIYTPMVFALAVLVTVIPYFFVPNSVFATWFYRALIFLVISCPCALVVAIPLGYFGGIGAASRHGILFKGASYLDKMRSVNTVAFDKTGTLTTGAFSVQKFVPISEGDTVWLKLAAAIEQQSAHPIARAIIQYAGSSGLPKAEDVAEIRGEGLYGRVAGQQVIVGNDKILKRFGLGLDVDVNADKESLVFVASDGMVRGYFLVGDALKPRAADVVASVHARKIKTYLLSGDRHQAVDHVARQVNIGQAFGQLLPNEKVERISAIKNDPSVVLAFVGDGINDAPALAVSDIGIAMGALGSDAAIETADVVIQTDQLSRIVTAIDISKETNNIIWQNIFFAFSVKAAVMVMGASGLATMWEAVFADVGVALLAILNAIRIQHKKFT